MKRHYWFNPFEKFSESKLLIAGISGVVFSVLLCWMGGQSNDGIYHISFYPNISFPQALAETVTCLLLPFALLLTAGRVVNAKTRMIDMLNATAIHRIPMMTGILLMQLPFFRSAMLQITEAVKNNTLQHISPAALWAATIIGLLLLAFFIWSIVLLVYGFKTATNAKKTWHYILFALAIILSEIIYRGFIYPSILKNFA